MESNTVSISLPELLVRTRRFTHGVPSQVTVASDRSSALFLRSRAGDDPVRCLWQVDAAGGGEALLADPAALLAELGQAPGDGIPTYSIDRAFAVVAFALAGRLWVLDLRTGRPSQLPIGGPVDDPQLDPTGQWIAYRTAGAVRVVRVDGSRDQCLVAAEGRDVDYGQAEHTGLTSTGGAKGMWWSPDGQRLLVARTDWSRVPQRYPVAGGPNPEVRLGIVSLDGGWTEAGWDRAAFEYLVGAGWDEHGPHATVQSRDQRTVRFLGIDPLTGESRLVSEQRDRCWVQLVPGLPARAPSGAVLSHLDRAGTRRLTVDGDPVSPPRLQLRAALTVDDSTGEVVFTASEDPTETHRWSYRPGLGVSRATPSPGVPIRSVAWTPPSELCARRLVLGPRNLRADLYRPSWHRSEGDRLPVLMDPYGGAARQRVSDERDWRCYVSQWFAEQGFAVLVVDGSGTPGRGPQWEREIHGDLFTRPVQDQVAALHEAARLHPELDLDRVGIRGWSFGGSLAVAAVLRRPDVFHAAVAGAGVTDQRRYPGHWRERVLGHPGDFADRYDACSLLRSAAALARPLLLMHGLADDNVLPEHTIRLSAALRAAGRLHELVLLPGVGHQAIGAPGTPSLLDRQLRFLQRQLAIDPR